MNTKIESEQEAGSLFVLPVASLIETGNHIAHIDGDKHEIGNKFADVVCDAIDNKIPWAAFTAQR